MALPVLPVLLVVALAAPGDELSVEVAVRLALEDNPSLAAGRAQVAARHAEARASAAAGLPTLSVSGQATVTNDPLAAFGMRLQERNVTAADFDPARLNSSDPIGSVGLGAQAAFPLYTGGRIGATREASAARAQAEDAQQRARSQQLALAVVAAYFGAQLAEERVRFAQNMLEDARETERLVKARVSQEQQPQSDAARASAFRAQAEAELVAARQRLADARDDLVLLVGERAREARLTSPVEVPGPAAESGVVARERAEIEAARHQELAARSQVDAVRAAGLPQVGVLVRGGALWGGGSALGAFATAGLEGRWDLLLPGQSDQTEAAQRSAAAAAELRRWTETQARVDVDKARRATIAARARVLAAEEGLASAESARDLRRARHREGLLPLTDLLDAEAALTAARSALLEARFSERLGRAQLQRAMGQPVEGVDR